MNKSDLIGKNFIRLIKPKDSSEKFQPFPDKTVFHIEESADDPNYIHLTWGNGGFSNSYSIGTAISLITEDDWCFIATEEQSNWMKSLLYDNHWLSEEERELIYDILHRKDFDYYTFKEREILNGLRELYPSVKEYE